MSSLECTNSIFNITNENNSISIIIPGHYRTEFAAKKIIDPNNLLELKSLELHVEEVRKRGNQIKTGHNENKLSDFDTQKKEILEELRNVKYNDLRDLANRMQITYDEIIDILDLKFNPTRRTGYSLNPGIYEVVDLNNTLRDILPNNVKVSVTKDDVWLKYFLKTNQTLIFTEKSFFYTILGLTRSRSFPLDDIDGFYQLIAGSYKSDKPINITGIDKIHLKCDYIQGSIVNGIREPILYSLVLSSPPGYKIFKEPRIKLFKKINKSVLSQSNFYFEDDDHKPVDFNGETIRFTCQLVQMEYSYLYRYQYLSKFTFICVIIWFLNEPKYD